MNSFVAQSRLLGTRPVVLNTLNITKPAAGEPTLLTVDEVVHALPRVRPRPARAALRRAVPDVRRARACRATSSSTPRRSTRCGCADPEIVDRYARHHETGEPLPDELRGPAGRPGAPRSARAFATTEYLAAALLDLAWHRLAPGEQVDRRRGVRGGRAGRASAMPERAAALPQHLLQPRLRRRLQRRLLLLHLERGARRRHRRVVHRARRPAAGERRRVPRARCSSRGGAVDPMEAYRAFRGRDPEIAPLLARRGLGG